MQANRLFLGVLITFLLSIAIRWVCNLAELYHKKSENISLARNKSQPIMLKTGASANAPVFCVRQTVIASANAFTTHFDTDIEQSRNTQCVSNKNLS